MSWHGDYPAPRVFSIAASDDFLSLVAQSLFADSLAKDRPDALADARILVPNSRIARRFSEVLLACAQKAGCSGLILPRLDALGHLGEALSGEDFDTEAVIAPDLAPPVPEGRKRGVLAKFVRALWQAERRPPLSPVQALAAADQLTQLFNLAETHGGADWDKLQDALSQSEAASHWEINAKFLKIIAKTWPEWLAEHGYSDPATGHRLAAQRLAESWSKTPPKSPVLVLGSTGATHAARTLMKIVMGLPQGAVILPMLDREASPEDWTRIATTPGHPQYVLWHTLKALGVAPEAVQTWPGSSNASAREERTRFINEALVPAHTTGDWHARLGKLAGYGDTRPFTRKALSGLRMISGDNEGQTARIAALLLRHVLEHSDKTAALVTPDPVFARRVHALLARWGIEVEPSIGTPLLLGQMGSFFSALLHWTDHPTDPISLLTLLKHALFRLGRDPDPLRHAIYQIEMIGLRGPVRYDSLDDLAKALEAKEAMPAAELIKNLHQALAPIAALRSEDFLDQTIVPALIDLAETLIAPLSFQTGQEASKLRRLLEKLQDLLSVWHDFPSHQLTPVFEALAEDQDLRLIAPDTHPRLAIWGQLEARLQHRDVLVLAGLNEGVWPRQPPESWLPRHLRIAAGFPDPEARIGLAAHDFAQLACKRDVWLLRSVQTADGPSIASRWWWRLHTLACAGLDDTDVAMNPDPKEPLQDWAQAIMLPAHVQPAKPPKPRPDAKLRPRTYSMTRARNLICDPFSVYARDILKLAPLEPVGAPMQARDRGTAIHAALEALEDLTSPSAEDLTDMIGQHLIQAGLSAEIFAMRRSAWQKSAKAYMAWRAERLNNQTRTPYREIKGELHNLGPDKTFSLTARADRIEQIAPSQYAIIDFKTGHPPSKARILDGTDPQMLLQAAILHRGGFEGLRGRVRELSHYKFHDGREDVKKCPQTISPLDAEKIDAVFEGFLRLASQFSYPGQPFLSRPNLKRAPYLSDYDRLARRAEWSADIGDGDDGGES